MILIVDDQRDLAHLLSSVLRYGGYGSFVAHSGAEALELARSSKPSLIILDVNMPDMDGLTVLKLLKQDDNLREVPVVMYSADPRDDKMEEARQLGAVDYVLKGSIDVIALVERFVVLAARPPASDSPPPFTLL